MYHRVHYKYILLEKCGTIFQKLKINGHIQMNLIAVKLLFGGRAFLFSLPAISILVSRNTLLPLESSALWFSCFALEEAAEALLDPLEFEAVEELLEAAWLTWLTWLKLVVSES